MAIQREQDCALANARVDSLSVRVAFIGQERTSQKKAAVL
jgi:hypothetical protein